MPERKDGPLEWLLREVGGSYMSDLRCGVRSAGTTDRMCRALLRVQAEDWTTAQWADAVGYLTNICGTFSSQTECVEWLLSYLEKT